MRWAVLTMSALLVGGLLAACSWNPEPVPIAASPSQLERLAGRWAGEFSGDESGRSGSILFDIEAGRDTAHGDVLMLPCAWRTPETVPGVPPEPRLLRIAFVAVDDGRVRGTLEVYRDPVCGCPLETTFTGRIRGDVIEGTYSSVHLDCGTTQSGRWRVERVGGEP